MPESNYRYIIVGNGLAGASAVGGIREFDQDGSILLIGNEPFLPYDRPPLTKKLWFGQKKVEDVFVHDDEYYAGLHADIHLGAHVTGIDTAQKTISDHMGRTFHYEKLLLATGGSPRRLDIPGGDLEGINYYRYLEDYLRLRPDATAGATATIIGGGFIGSELGAALTMNGVAVTMIFPDPYLVNRVFPEGLGRAITDHFRTRGVNMLTGDKPTMIERRDGKFVTTTEQGQQIA